VINDHGMFTTAVIVIRVTFGLDIVRDCQSSLFFDCYELSFVGPGRRVAKTTLVVVVVVISSLKNPKAFLIHSEAQGNFAYTHSC